jgi:uncharacterized protein YecE (DUF72 family)
MVKSWYKKTPEHFRFTAKFPKAITHDKRFKDVDKELEYFFNAVDSIHDKTLALLIQLPPSLEISEGLEKLKQLLPLLDNRYRYAIEARHESWFQQTAYNFFAENNICLAWSQLATIKTPPVVTSDFMYVRLIGDRSIDEKDFGRIQKDRSEEMQEWADKLKVVQQEGKQVKLAIVSANNHYAGFGPATVNFFRQMMDLPSVNWQDRLVQTESTSTIEPDQKSLSDYL